MYHADESKDSADLEKPTGARSGRLVDEEVLFDRTPVVADMRGDVGDTNRSGIASERRRSERRRIDRMSTGI